MQYPESKLRILVADWLNYNYKDIIYRFDLAADIRLTVGQASQHKRLHPFRGYPDLFIAEPRGQYHGLYIELKAEGKSPFKKDGTLKTNEHLREQADVLQKLREKGYKAEFATGVDETIELIKSYLAK